MRPNARTIRLAQPFVLTAGQEEILDALASITRRILDVILTPLADRDALQPPRHQAIGFRGLVVAKRPGCPLGTHGILRLEAETILIRQQLQAVSEPRALDRHEAHALRAAGLDDRPRQV